PTNANLTQALTNKNVPMVKLLLRYNAPVTQENLNYTIYNNQAEFTRMMIAAGMKPTTLQLNTAIEKSFPDVVAALLESVKPDNESYVKAATTNNTKVFTMLTGSNVRITNVEPAKISIEKKNLDILRMALDMGSSPDQALATAIKANYPAGVDVCLSKGAKPEPALKYAIQQNNTSMFTSLIKDYGANPDIALDNAFENSKIEFTKLALSLGAAPNSQMAKQASAGNEANVKLLIESGADPNLGVSGAIQNNQPQLLDYLIEKGATTNSSQDLATAVQKSSLQMVQSLVRNGSDPQGGIDMAVKMKNHEIMIFLFESGASPEGFLANASSGGDLKIVQILLDYGANPTEGIKMAIDNNKMDVAELLLESGADPKGMLPGATGHGSVKIVTMLLERGENPNDGIEISVKKNLTDVALVILSYNPSIEGLIPIASLFGNDRIVERLLEMGADPQEGIEEAVYKNQVSTAKLLLDHGAQVRSGKFTTLAVQTENVNMLKLMVDNGSDYNIIDAEGNSLLHIAAALGSQQEILQLLLDLKLDPNLKNKEGDAPIHVAVSVRGKDNLPAVETLHKGGADLNMPNAEGKLPVKIAKNNKVKKYMKDNGGVKKEK
ncbi:MAG: ankyrin repeat domain-containing protein, partial [Bacteroidetes bacterium]|nr:ankyrin repeat domain-containing protein [Bacteroidota bacterium]